MNYMNLAKEQKFVMNTEIGKKEQEIVDKCLEVNNAVKKHASIAHNPDQMIKLAEGLDFSESTLIGIESCTKANRFGDLQFSDPATPFVGNWTAGTVNMVIQEIGSSQEQNTKLSLAFPDTSVPMYKVSLDRFTGVAGMLPEFSGDNGTLPTVKPLNSSGIEYQPGLWAARTSLQSKDIMFARERGGVNFNDRGYGQLLAYNTVNMATQAFTRKKYLLNQAIFNNGFTYAGASISSNIPSENYITLNSMGTLNADGTVTYANPDPLYTPFVSITNFLSNPIFLKYRNYIKGILVNGVDLQWIMNHPNVKAVTNLFMAGNNSLGSKTINIEMNGLSMSMTGYYAPSFEFPLIADDEVWVAQDAAGDMNNASQNFFVPRGKMYVLLDFSSAGSAAGPSGAFHLTYNEVDPNSASPAMGLFTGAFARNLNNSDTVNRIDIVAALSGAPAVYRPKDQFILTGLYSNV